MVGGGITLGVAIGAPLGGFIGDSNPLVPLYTGSLLVLGAAALTLWQLEETGGAERRPSLSTIATDLRGHPLLLAPLVFAFADRFTVGFYTTTFSLFLGRIHDLSASSIGMLIASFMLPFALLSYPFGQLSERRISRVGMICTGSLIYGLATLFVPWCPLPGLTPLMLALGVASAVMFVPSLLITSDAAPAEIRTTAMGAFNAAGSLGFIIGPVTGGLVSQWVAQTQGWEAGYRAAFGVAGASEIACILLALPFLLRLRRIGLTT